MTVGAEAERKGARNVKRYEDPKDIKVGAIGYGGAFNMGKQHLAQMAQAGMTPVAVTDPDESRLEVAKEDYPGIAVFKSTEEMLEGSDVNLLAIITPHNTHAKIAIQCLEAGRHVVTEKPFAVTTAECDAMIEAAKKSDCLVSTYHNRHWDGCVLKAVEQIGGGAVGDVVRIEAHMGGYRKPGDWWRTSKSISGGVLYDWGVHLLEYSLQIMDAGRETPCEIAEVTGYAKAGFWADQTAWKDDTNEDEAFAIIRLKDGRWLTLCITNIDSNAKRGQLEVTGTKGTYIMEGGSWEIITRDGDATTSRKGRSPRSEGQRFYQNIADHLTKGDELVITAEWARRPIHVLDLANQSAKKGEAIKATYC